MVSRSRVFKPRRAARQRGLGTQPVEHYISPRADSLPSHDEHRRLSRGNPDGYRVSLGAGLRI